MKPTPEIKEFVFSRLRAMHDRPLMWASNTESFVFQLLLLAEFMGADDLEFKRIKRYILGNVSVTGIGELTEESARHAVEDARERIAYLGLFNSMENSMQRYAAEITPDFDGFCSLWRFIGAHQETYGQPPHYRKTAEFLANGGFMTVALKRG